MRKTLFILLTFVSVLNCKGPEARVPVTKKSGSFIKESIERNKELNAREHNKIKALIANLNDTTYIASNSGFWYKYNHKVEEESILAEFGDIVNFKYCIKDLNGNIIYSEDELQTQNYTMDQQEIFTGLREGLKLMKVGETLTFIFPSQKAYGYYGDENKIGTNVPLICQVTLNSITKNE